MISSILINNECFKRLPCVLVFTWACVISRWWLWSYAKGKWFINLEKIWLNPSDSKSVELSPLSCFAFSGHYPGKYQDFLLWVQKGDSIIMWTPLVLNGKIHISKSSSSGVFKSHSPFNLLDGVQLEESYLIIKK